MTKVVFEQRSVVVSADGSSGEKVRHELQVLDAKYIDKLKTVVLPYCRSKMTIKVTKAMTHQPDGLMVDVPKNAIVTRAVRAKSSRCPEEVAITFPELKLGSTLIYEAEFRGTAEFSKQFFYARTIPKSWPVDRFRLEVTFPSSMSLNVDSPRVSWTRAVSQTTTTYRFDYAHPSKTFDAYDLINPRDAAAGIYLSTFKSYSDLAKAFGTRFYPKAAVTAEIQKKADEIVAGMTNPRGKAQKIHEWVKSNIRYEVKAWDDGAVPREASAVLSSGYGDCKGQAVLLVALLKAEEIEADFVLLDVDQGYTLPKVPVGVFNHVITYLPAFDIYQDTTGPDVGFGNFPRHEWGRMGLLVTQDGGKTVVLPGVRQY